jgi:excisionase family DNA binding protein
MAYEHLGLHPFAEPIPVGPGGRLGDGSAGEPVLAEVAAVAPELELAPELGELTKLDWGWETAVGWPVARPPEGAVVLGGVDPRVGRDLAERLVIARVWGRWCLRRGRGVPALLLVSRCRVLSAFASVICVWTTCAVGCCATVESRRAAAGVNTWVPRTPAAMTPADATAASAAPVAAGRRRVCSRVVACRTPPTAARGPRRRRSATSPGSSSGSNAARSRGSGLRGVEAAEGSLWRWRRGITGATLSSPGGCKVPLPPLGAIPAILSHYFAFLAIIKCALMDDPELLTVSQAAEAFSATSQTVRNWIREDRLHAVRIGNRFLIPREEIHRLRGDLGSQAGESPWDYSPDEPTRPLRRQAGTGAAAADPADGLLGA